MTYRPQLPEHPPTPADLAERDEFQQLVRDSLPRVQASAEKWRTGLAAFITLVTTGFVIKGRDVTSAVPTGWRVAITACVAAGLLLSVFGLWQALAAHAGGRSLSLTLDDIRHEHGSVQAFRVATARRAARRLDVARRSVAVGLLCLLTGVGLTWWSPPAPSTPPAYVRVEQGGDSTCGTLASADGQTMRVAVAGRSAPETIPFAAITNVTVVASC
ncbi:hypothetical protein [Actinokineospora enzanensis]|uniref:hypothetical protein n=1 Tax=Actinokineospora enzanensis TaxID=155975 RepID=UPI000381A557|nr:hypothetical protein [Actinokineospora enzanensis]